MQEKNMGHICPIGRSGVKTEFSDHYSLFCITKEAKKNDSKVTHIKREFTEKTSQTLKRNLKAQIGVRYMMKIIYQKPSLYFKKHFQQYLKTFSR